MIELVSSHSSASTSKELTPSHNYKRGHDPSRVTRPPGIIFKTMIMDKQIRVRRPSLDFLSAQNERACDDDNETDVTTMILNRLATLYASISEISTLPTEIGQHIVLQLTLGRRVLLSPHQPSSLPPKPPRPRQLFAAIRIGKTSLIDSKPRRRRRKDDDDDDPELVSSHSLLWIVIENSSLWLWARAASSRLRWIFNPSNTSQRVGIGLGVQRSPRGEWTGRGVLGDFGKETLLGVRRVKRELGEIS